MAKDRKGGSTAHTNGKEKEEERSISKEQQEQEQEEDRTTDEARSKRDHGRKMKRKKESETEEEEEDYSSEHGRRKKRKRKDSKRSSRRRRYSDEDSHSSSTSSSSDSSGSGSDFDSDSEENESEDERHRRKRKERERRRRKEKEKRRIRREKEKERKKRKKDKKKEKKKKKEVKKGAVTNSWGKYGIIRETDMWNKRPEFTAWLAEVKQVNLEALSNWEEKQMFKEFMEDHNTATFRSKKYYDLDAYHKQKMEKEMKKGSRRGLESERTIFNDEEQRRQELQLAREKLKEQEVETLKRSMQSGLAQAMKEQAQLREEMAYQYKLGNFEAAAAIQRRLDPDVAM